MSKELYEDLQTTPTSEILNLDKLAFRFANKRREMDEVVNWEADLISSVKEAVDHYQEKVTTLLSLLLPKLADGFFVQRGNIFGFGNYDPASPMLVTSKNMEQLNHRVTKSTECQLQKILEISLNLIHKIFTTCL